MGGSSVNEILSSQLSYAAFFAIVGFVVTCVTLAWTGFQFVSATNNAVRKEAFSKIDASFATLSQRLDDIISTHDERANHLQERLEARVEALALKEGSAREKLASDLQGSVTRIEAGINAMHRDSISKDDFRSLAAKVDTVMHAQADLRVLVAGKSQYSEQ